MEEQTLRITDSDDSVSYEDYGNIFFQTSYVLPISPRVVVTNSPKVVVTKKRQIGPILIVKQRDI